MPSRSRSRPGGAAVAVNARTSKEDADKVVQEIREAGGQAEVFMADIVDAKAVNAMVDGIVKRFGRLDILVLNASVRKETPFIDMSFDEWKSLHRNHARRLVPLRQGLPAAPDQGRRRRDRDDRRHDGALRREAQRARIGRQVRALRHDTRARERTRASTTYG